MCEHFVTWKTATKMMTNWIAGGDRLQNILQYFSSNFHCFHVLWSLFLSIFAFFQSNSQLVRDKRPFPMLTLEHLARDWKISAWKLCILSAHEEKEQKFSWKLFLNINHWMWETGVWCLYTETFNNLFQLFGEKSTQVKFDQTKQRAWKKRRDTKSLG